MHVELNAITDTKIVIHSSKCASLRFGTALATSVAATLLAACSTISPTQPSSGPESPLPTVENSSITVPIQVSTVALAQQIDGVLDGPIYYVSGKDIGGNKSLQIGLRRQGNTTVTTDNGCLALATPVVIYDGRIDWYETINLLIGSKKIKKHFDFGGSGLVKARACVAVGSDWKLQANVIPDFAWIEGAWIDLNPPFGHIKIGVADLVESKLREKLPGITEKISNLASTVPIKEIVERTWLAAQKPVSLSHNPELTLEVEPVSFGVGPTTSEGLALVIRPTVVAKVRVHAGTGVPPAQLKPLPPNTGTLGGDTFSLAVRADAPFAELNALAQERLVGKPIELAEGRTVTPDAVRISSAGNKLILRVDFHARLSWLPFANFNGWLYLTGTPKYDDVKRQLSVDDFDFDVNTRNLLVESASALVHKHFLQQLRTAMVYNLAGKIDPLRTRVLAGVQGMKIANGVELNATVQTFDFSTIHIGSDGIGIFSTAKGSANVMVAPGVK